MNSTTEAPQDSVLRRHWEASRHESTIPSRASNAAASPSQASSGGGFFSWLKSLFS